MGGSGRTAGSKGGVCHAIHTCLYNKLPCGMLHTTFAQSYDEVNFLLFA